MKKMQISFFGFFGFFLLFFSSCIGDDSETYQNAYGYVSSTSSGTVFINTSAGYSITWNGISSELQPDSCVKISYETDYSILNDAYNVKNVSYTKLAQCKLSSETPLEVSDSISSLNISMYSPYLWFGDNWFVSIKTLRYPGLSASPKFYYSSDNVENFDPENNDSIIINARVEFLGTRDTSIKNTVYVNTQEYAVDLSPIRSLMNSIDSIPIYFRYYSSKAGKPSYTTVKYMLKSSYSN